ncbi:MAG: hypothetical protein KC944_11720 [Candidatus Omnitrophica bacterium]|nr:hypothetical protein [Candidatus Omnitrophota bacterium]
MIRNLATLFGMKQFRLTFHFLSPPTVCDRAIVSEFGDRIGQSVGISTVISEGPLDQEGLAIQLLPISAGAEPSLILETTQEGPILRYKPGTLSFGLDEIGNQLEEILNPAYRAGWEPFRLERRITVGGLRIGPELWNSEDFRERLALLSSLGIDSLALDIVHSPNTYESVEEETQRGEWLEAIVPKIERVQALGISPILNFPIQLDLSPSDTKGGGPFCRQEPSGRRQIIHRFENLIQAIPEIGGVGFVITDWGRCRCNLCQEISFEEEAAYYLRAFAAVLQRHRPGLSRWAFPDEISQQGLLEIQSQIPPDTKMVAPHRHRASMVWRIGEDRGRGDEDGEVYSLDSRLDGDFFRSDRVFELLDRWENLSPPHSFFGDLHGCSQIPVNTLSLIPLFWTGDFPGRDWEKWILRRMLPLEERESWEYWRETNQRMLDSVTRPSASLQNLHPGLLTVKSSDQKSTRQFDLPQSLSSVANRLRLDEELKSIEESLGRIPEGERIHGELAYDMQGIAGRVYSLLHPQQPLELEASERRCLESLSDYLNLLLSDGRNRMVWSADQLPSLIPIRTHRLRPAQEEDS